MRIDEDRSRRTRLYGAALWLLPFLMLGLAAPGCDGDEDVVETTAVPAAGEVEPAPPPGSVAAVNPSNQATGQLAVQSDREGEQVRQFIMYPTGQRDTSVLMIEQISPAEVRAGQPYDYQIKLTNLTAAPLAGVTVRQALPQSFAIETAQPSISQMQQAQPSTRPSQQQTAQATQPSQQGQQQMAQTTQPSQQGQQQMAQATTQPSQQQDTHHYAVANWRLGELGPGETRTINVRAFANNVGDFASCITADYEPTLCAMTKVINPQLRLVKQGPQRADLCEPLAYTYAVTNTGTGTAKQVVIQDPLPEGLVTEDGQQQVEIEVGELPAGQTKDFQVALKPSRAGEFASRAMASSAGDKVYSDRVATTIVRPNLALKIDAPESQVINQRFTYNVTVTNNGDAPAEQAVLNLDIGDGAEYVRIPRQAEDENEAQVAAAEVAGEDGEAVAVGTLQPGESKTVRLTFVGRQEGQAAIAAVANAECAEAAQARAQTYIATIPALQVWVVDAEDPVQVGQNVTYIVSVTNEGSGDASNVGITGTLPQGMTFVSGKGETEVKGEGQNVNLGTIPTLAAGQELRWNVVAKADQAGNSQFKVQLKADSLNQPAVASEPTTLVQ